MESILDFFYRAYEAVSKTDYAFEMDYVDHIEPLEKQTADNFFLEYVWVVLNAGMREQAARKVFDRFCQSIRDGHIDFDIIRHPTKRKAIEDTFSHYTLHFQNLQAIHGEKAQIEYLETMPWIGPITKFHLARNIGIDTVKPDRHLVRLAERFGYNTPLEMCEVIKAHNGTKVGTIDVILWRFCNLYGHNEIDIVNPKNQLIE